MTKRGVRRALLGALALASSLLVPSIPAGAARPATMTVVPAAGLVDGQRVSVVLRGAAPTSVWAVAECGPGALAFYVDHSHPSQDGCEQRTSWVMPVDAGKMGALSVSLHAVLTTAVGAVDCRSSQCFIALQELTGIDGSGLKLANLTFAASACDVAKSCRTAPDAWSPQGGRPTGVSGPLQDTSGGTGIAEATATSPAVVSGLTPLDASTSPERTAPGPYVGPLDAGLSGGGEGSPQGVLALALSAPGTSWGPGNASAVVADVTVTDVTTSAVLPTQQVVLHRGATTFTYTCALGAISSSHTYTATVAAERDARLGGLSQLPARNGPGGRVVQAPRLVVADAAVLAVADTTTIGLADRYAPVIYGRSTSALHDTPLLLDATVTPVGDGESIDYTAIFSHEDAGTAYVPSLELATWGRLTDIETVVHLDVAADGSITGGTYFWGGVPRTGYPDSAGALREVSKAFSLTTPRQWEGTHPVIRVATGNNDVVAGSTSPFRFDLPVVAGPAAGATRESVMDAHPFTYGVMADEAARWYANLDDTPTSPQMGDVSQYVVADLATSVVPGTSVSGLALEVEVSGTWFSADQGWGYPQVGAGHLRTTVKLPFGWSTGQVQAVRVAVSPPSSASGVTVDALALSHVADDGTLTPVPPLAPSVVGRTPAVTPVVAASRYAAGSDHARSGYLLVRVADALGYPLDGITTTMALPKKAFDPSCATCRTVAGVSGAPGPHYTGLAYLGWSTTALGLAQGTTTSVTTEDRAMPPVELSLDR
jgi:hypothetical protein